ncbi:ribosyldihydronicotinamide dehydrogenase [quinone] isoform X1 [Sorex araneus]|uniref:ribosyldihydronicotinamide dehydrogenase [quinone] isoform X1 n=1 Tax=Sorex araneus TaxID=42254 RepID=UPI002433C41D|nr:ribosyldihydronicotinamide dehydrogenase [quinone] isoform X1 [Sorex araneus]
MAGKKVLIVYAHQDPGSFNAALKKVAVDELSRQGCLVTVTDLYALDFEPRATRKDFTGALSDPEHCNYGLEAFRAYQREALSRDITAEQEKVREADLVIFQFPLYWYSLPAVLKGWMDRVLCQGFAFDFPGFFESGFLKGKRAVLSFTTGGSAEMYSKTGISGDIRCYLWPIQNSEPQSTCSGHRRKGGRTTAAAELLPRAEVASTGWTAGMAPSTAGNGAGALLAVSQTPPPGPPRAGHSPGPAASHPHSAETGTCWV